MSNRLTGDYHKTLDKTYLGHWDCPPGGDLVVTIDYFEKNDVKNNTGATEKKHICHFREVKPMIVNKTNLKMIASVLGSPNFEDWEGQQIALYAADVKQAEDGKGLRVRPYRPKAEILFCKDCGQQITDYEGHSAKKIANNALTRFGRYLCYECAVKAKTEEEAFND